jgi:DNA repair exonuclease SbcCD ATPase subunit
MNHSLTEIDMNFQRVLILGRSNKNDRISNGVGKTTIFRAIEYVLFNQSYATVLDKIVRDGTKKAIVEFDFELNGEIFRIYRHHCNTGTSDVRLYKKIGDVFEPISGRTPTETNELIRKLIKISHKAFTYSVLFRQADLTGITSTADLNERKKILKEPLNLALYTKLEDLATKKVRPIKKEIDKLEGSVSVIGNPDVDIKKAEEELVSTLDQIKKQRELIDSINATVEQKRKLVDDLKQSLGQQDIDIHSKVSEKSSAIKKLKDASKENDKRLESISDVISTKEARLKKNKEEETTAQEKLASLTSETNEDIEDLQQKYDSVCADEMKGGEIIAAAKAKIKFIKKTIPDSDECPSCNQSITSEYRKKISEEIAAKIKKQEEEIEFLEDALGKCRRKKSKLDILLKAARTRVNDISKIETLIQTLGNEQKSLREEIDRQYLDQNATTRKIQDEEQQIREAEESLRVLREAAAQSSALTINTKIFALNQEISKHQDEIIDNNRRISTLSTLQGGLEERITTRLADKVKLENIKNSLVKNQRELKIRQMVVDSFSNRGIPTFIIQTILNDLQIEVNKTIQELRPELQVQIDEELNFEYKRNGIVKTYEQLSHGQHVYLALAFKRALSNIIKLMMGIPINMIFLDEIDAHLDEYGIEAFSDALNKWQKDFTIFVITHNKDLKDKFSHAILVEETENDGATVAVVTSW